MQTISGLRERSAGIFSGGMQRFGLDQSRKQGYGQMDGGDEDQYNADVPDSPASFEEVERPPLRHIDKYTKAECPCLSVRFTVAMMTCFGFIITFGIRCNLSMAKLELDDIRNKTSWNAVARMLHNITSNIDRNHSRMDHNFTHYTISNKTHSETFNTSHSTSEWSSDMASAIDSAFFWGYLVTQVPGGFLASAFPANRIFGAAVICSSCLNMLIPLAIYFSPIMLIAVKMLQGLVEGVTYPACHGIWRFWAPPLERSRLATFAFSGSYAGIVIGLPVSAILADYNWQYPFYVYSFAGIIWYISWLWLVFEKPRNHPTIQTHEVRYIEKSLGQSVQQAMPTISSTPWHDILRSAPVYAIIVANFCRSYNFYMLVLYQSAYIKQVFKINIDEVGMIGAIPHLTMTLIVPFGGMLADHIRKSGWMSTTNVRKLFNCGGFGMEGLFFLVVAHSKTMASAVTALTLGVAFSAFAISGYNVNHLDIAPRYASILMGISNGIGTTAGLICPIVINHITEDKRPESWTTVFTIGACVHLFGISVYGYFASGELQPWAELNEEKSCPPAYNTNETEFNEPNPDTHISTTTTVNYGAIQQQQQQHVKNNPFAMDNTMMQENPVQPEAKDTYLYPNLNE